MLHFYFRNYDDVILPQHVLELLVNRALQEEHVNFYTLAVGNQFIHFLNPAIYHRLE